jgi:hypothetical protein
VRELFGRGIGTYLERKAGAASSSAHVAGDVVYSPDVR